MVPYQYSNTTLALSLPFIDTHTHTHTRTHSNLDVTLILQKPRVSPIKHKMKENLVRVLKTTDSQVLSLFLSFSPSPFLFLYRNTLHPSPSRPSPFHSPISCSNPLKFSPSGEHQGSHAREGRFNRRGPSTVLPCRFNHGEEVMQRNYIALRTSVHHHSYYLYSLYEFLEPISASLSIHLSFCFRVV
jgi:hypothetical protein